MSVNGFPHGFRFGAATAAIQIEGGTNQRGESIWDSFSRVPGSVADGGTPDVACDHYHRWQEDLDLMAELGLRTYRFSISWPRILPDGAGRPSRAGVDFYRRLLEGLWEREIQPLATLYHWDLPQALHDRGGWPARETAYRFAEYAALVFEELGDLVDDWVTINEPWVVAFLGHGFGTKAPGRRDWAEAIQVAHHVLLGHGLAVGALRELGRDDATIGITLDLWPTCAASPSREDEAAARRWDGAHNRWFLDPVLRGAYPADVVAWYEPRFGRLDAVHDGDLELISRPIDFLGVNYYSRDVVGAAPANGPLELARATPRGPTTGMGWEVAPDSFHALLVRLKREYGDVPISITENGAAYDDPVPANGLVEDPERLEYLRGHLDAVRRAVADGVDVRSYFTWSLLDNFEWEHGYDKRFGIVYVDYETQRRIPKRSALWYRDFIAAHAAGAP
jgi:beta-glucosidase